MKQYISKLMFVVLLVLAGGATVRAQYGFGTNNPHPAAVVDMTSTTRGCLPPRLSSNQIAAIPRPVEEGMTVYNIDLKCLMYYSKGSFVCSNVPPAPAPVAYNVVTTGNVELALPLAASYTYAQYSGIGQGATRLQWYYKTGVNGVKQAIGGATTTGYTPNLPVKEGNYIAFGVTPVAADGTTGLEVLSTWREVKVNQPPYYTSVSIETTNVNQISVANSVLGDYYDLENDQQDTKTYRWLLYTDEACATTPTVLAAGPGALTYTFVDTDLDKYIKLGVTTTAKTGAKQGVEVLSDKIGPIWFCGKPLKIVHNPSRGVAPETKNVNYETVVKDIKNIGIKCWITQNLGATYPPKSISAPEEIYAGWYWQFNTKQGYKNTGGTSNTPAWKANSNSGTMWDTNNDPCKIELGSGWHVLTTDNWYHFGLKVQDRLKAWSAIKLHDGGYINSSGALKSRGSLAVFWSNEGTDRASVAQAFNTASLAGDTPTAELYETNANQGLPIRCLRD